MFRLVKPDGQFAGDNVEKYGPWHFGTVAEAEKVARTLEADYDWPEGSVLWVVE